MYILSAAIVVIILLLSSSSAIALRRRLTHDRPCTCSGGRTGPRASDRHRKSVEPATTVAVVTFPPPPPAGAPPFAALGTPTVGARVLPSPGGRAGGSIGSVASVRRGVVVSSLQSSARRVTGCSLPRHCNARRRRDSATIIIYVLLNTSPTRY